MAGHDFSFPPLPAWEEGCTGRLRIITVYHQQVLRHKRNPGMPSLSFLPGDSGVSPDYCTNNHVLLSKETRPHESNLGFYSMFYRDDAPSGPQHKVCLQQGFPIVMSSSVWT